MLLTITAKYVPQFANKTIKYHKLSQKIMKAAIVLAFSGYDN